MLGSFAITINGKEYVWKRTFAVMHQIETVTGKSLARLAGNALDLKAQDIFNILRSVVSKDDVTDKHLKDFIASDYDAVLSAVVDVLVNILSNPREPQPGA